MKILVLVFLFSIYETLFHLVIGQSINNEKSDCTKLYNFFKGDFNDYANKCCTENLVYYIKCDSEGYITYLTIMERDKIVENTELTSFPYFSRIRELEIYDLKMKEIPNDIFKLTTLRKIYFSENDIEEIPPAIENLSQLKELIITSNNLKELPNELFNLVNLKNLELSTNQIEIIPPAIQNLSNLEYLLLYNNNLKELPNEIFNLSRLHNFDLQDNQNLNIKIINFNNSTIKYCDFTNVNILCYEPHTCQLITLRTLDVIRDENAHKEFKICSREDIDTIISQKESKKSLILEDNKNILEDNKIDVIQKEKKSNSLFVIILGCIIVACIGILVSLMLIKKNKNKKSNKSYVKLDDENQTKTIIEYSQNNDDINSTNAKLNMDNNNFNYNVNRNKTIMASLNEMMEEIYHKGSYSSFSSYGFSSFSSK